MGDSDWLGLSHQSFPELRKHQHLGTRKFDGDLFRLGERMFPRRDGSYLQAKNSTPHSPVCGLLSLLLHNSQGHSPSFLPSSFQALSVWGGSFRIEGQMPSAREQVSPGQGKLRL